MARISQLRCSATFAVSLQRFVDRRWSWSGSEEWEEHAPGFERKNNGIKIHQGRSAFNGCRVTPISTSSGLLTGTNPNLFQRSGPVYESGASIRAREDGLRRTVIAVERDDAGQRQRSSRRHSASMLRRNFRCSSGVRSRGIVSRAYSKTSAFVTPTQRIRAVLSSDVVSTRALSGLKVAISRGA